jgi:hypothetical protein
MNPGVHDIPSHFLAAFSLKVLFVLGIDVFNDGLEAKDGRAELVYVAVSLQLYSFDFLLGLPVELITESGSINDS